MRNILVFLGWFFMAGSAIVGAILSIYLRLTNVDMTEMRLFLTYWHVFVPLILTALFGACLIKLEK